jgi:hypothetical protein
VATSSVPRDACANGRFPAANEVFFSPTDATFVGIRTSFGILLSHDGGSTWYWLCEDTLGIATSTEDPPIAMTEGGSLVAALSIGLDVSVDGGCDWSFVGGPLSGQIIKDVALRPDAPHTVLAITGTYEADAGDGAAPGFAQQVYQSVDDGVHWSAIGVPIDPSALVTTLDVAASDPNRLYASAVRQTTDPQSGLTTVRGASLFVSTDTGATWVERPIPFNPALAGGAASVASDGTAIFIAAVDPTNADRVYVRSDGMSQLFVTSDAGKTWSVALSLADPMLGFALSSDGSRVYAGSVGAGVLVASAATLSFAQVSTVHVQCLAAHRGDLWACSDEPSGFIVGQSTTGGASFAPRLPTLLGITAPIRCPADAGASVCSSFDFGASPPYDPFGALCTNLQACAAQGSTLPPLSAACTSDGQCPVASGGGTPTNADSRSSPGCSTAQPTYDAYVMLVAAAVGVAARRRSRRKISS